MGGVGSGNRHRFDKKTTVGETHGLDVRRLHRESLLEGGRVFSWRWSRAGRETGSVRGEVTGVGRPELLTLAYRSKTGPRGDWEDVTEPVPLEWTSCNFGGERPWFLCPSLACGRRVAILYGPGRYFLCRHCYDLRYESQRENGTHRALRRAQKIRERLGGTANMTEPFPERPKGMHWRTCERLWREHNEAEMEHLAGTKAWLEKLKRKTG